MIRHEIPIAVKGEELSRYLKRAYPLTASHVMRDLLKKRDVRVNGVKSGRGASVRGGDVLEIYAPEKYFQGDVEVLFNDGHLLATVKPQGLPALPDQDGVGADTMEERLKRMYPTARLCHRLDAATGGVMLAALDDASEVAVLEMFKRHEMKKAYRAILCGKPPRKEMEMRAWLFKDARRATVRVTDKAAPGAREIITRAKLLGDVGENLWAAELEPVTGRTHQLRAHMAHIGCPILGDDKYGDREKNRETGFVNRLCLWCETMEIPQNSPLPEYAGQKFHAEAPQWLNR